MSVSGFSEAGTGQFGSQEFSYLLLESTPSGWGRANRLPPAGFHDAACVATRPLTTINMANYVLEILDGDRAGEVLPVGDSTIRIGRKTGNDIVLTDEKTSGVHCEIMPEGDRLVLKDLGSTNGTFLDGKRVTELVLTPGDIVTIGRTKVKYRELGDDSAGAGDYGDADAGEFAMRTIDAGRLKKRGGSIGLIALLLLVIAGGGGWYWWDGQQAGPGQAKGAPADTKPLAVSGNRLDAVVATCETDESWSLRTAGHGFRSGGQPHTGSASFSAYHDLDEGDEAKVVKSDDDFAVMQLAQPIEVFAGRTLTIAAYVKTTETAQIALRSRVFASNEDVPFRFCHGTKMAAFTDGWQRIECFATIPTGCDRLSVEVVALLPDQDCEALVDDIAVTAGGDENSVEIALKESGQTAFGFGSSVAVRSTDSANPGTVLRVLPNRVPEVFTRLHKAGYCVLSDLGASLSCSENETGLEFVSKGSEGLQFVMPIDAAGGLLVAEGTASKFASVAVQSSFDAQRVLFGSYATRAMLQVDAKVKVSGAAGSGLYRVLIEADQVSLVLGFRSQRQQAGAHVRNAEEAQAEGRPGDALDLLAQLFEEVPMDSESLTKAQRLRVELLSAQASEIAALRSDLEEADFFKTRGGFERVAAGVDELVALYGAHNVEDLADAEALRSKARERLVGLDQATHAPQRERLTALADAFGLVGQQALQKIVSDYILRHLNGK